MTKRSHSPASFTLHELIGTGVSSVNRATDNTTGVQVALKLTQRDQHRVSAGSLANFNSEIAALSLLSHPHIIQLVSHDFDWTHTNEHGIEYNYLCIALELCTNGDLFEFVKVTDSFSEDLGRTYFRQLMETVKYCHDMGVVHRDLKPENLLLDQHFDLKIADFGSAKVRDFPSFLCFGTDGYRAPEVRPGEVSGDPKIDVYGCGLVLFFMIFRELTLCRSAQYKRYLRDKAQFWSQRSKCSVSSSLLELLNAMLEPDPHLRISVTDILSHPWMMGKILSSEDLQTEMAGRKSRLKK